MFLAAVDFHSFLLDVFVQNTQRVGLSMRDTCSTTASLAEQGTIMTSYQRTFGLTVGLLITAFATSAVRAQTPDGPPGIVRYSAELTEITPGSSPVSNVFAGVRYRLTAFVQDASPDLTLDGNPFPGFRRVCGFS